MISIDFIREEIFAQTYEISIHADDERIAESLTVEQVESALLSGSIIEQDTEDPRGASCLVLGFASGGLPVHVVCGQNRSRHLIIITVYKPSMPKWKDPNTRNR
ncbi:MAG: DUF4258 domain-containing protein [Candidatus Hydrogenedentes bacterium]|nr:DUF4258 domain-containing protein [Candidatus Hydrogenedentota bacterium]